jgi:hypothetical protein
MSLVSGKPMHPVSSLLLVKPLQHQSFAVVSNGPHVDKKQRLSPLMGHKTTSDSRLLGLSHMHGKSMLKIATFECFSEMGLCRNEARAVFWTYLGSI